MSPDIVMLIMILANPVAMLFAGIWLRRFGMQMERPIYAIFGKILYIAAPISLIVGLLSLAIRH